jgi:hypothetical protein
MHAVFFVPLRRPRVHQWRKVGASMTLPESLPARPIPLALASLLAIASHFAYLIPPVHVTFGDATPESAATPVAGPPALHPAPDVAAEPQSSNTDSSMPAVEKAPSVPPKEADSSNVPAPLSQADLAGIAATLRRTQ